MAQSVDYGHVEKQVTESIDQIPSGAKHVVIAGGGFAGLNCARKVSVRSSPLDRAAVSKAEVSTYFKWTLIEWV